MIPVTQLSEKGVGFNTNDHRRDNNDNGVRQILSRSLKNFEIFAYNRLNFAPQTFNAMGGVFTASGIGIMSYSGKLQSTTFGAPFIFAGGFMITLLGMTSLYAGKQVTQVQRCVKSSQSIIRQYEESGDYATALDIARNSYEESLKMGLSQELRDFSQTVKRLEEELLSLGFSRMIFDENYQPRVKLLQLLHDVEMESLNESERAIVQINDWAQKNLLRQGERWLQATDRFEELKPKIKPLLSELGFVDGIFPHFKDYQGALIHGALLPRVRLRLQYLVEQWKKGVRFSHVYFLSGERPLEDSQEKKEISKDYPKLLEFPETECRMIQLVWEKSYIPEDMRKEVEVHFIDAPMKEDAKGKRSIRPTTDDTVEAWLETQPPLGRYLAVTNAPYINRQDLVVRAIASGEYGFDTVGSGASEHEKTAIFLDELARLIFQTKQQFFKKYK